MGGGKQLLAGGVNLMGRPRIGRNRLNQRVADDAAVGRQELPPFQLEIGIAKRKRTVQVAQLDVVQILGQHKRIAHVKISWSSRRAARRATSKLTLR